MNIKYLFIYLIMQIFPCHITVAYNPTTKEYKEVSMLANEALKKLAYEHYENPKRAVDTRTKGGQKFQEGGMINSSNIRAFNEKYRKDQNNAKSEQLQGEAASTGEIIGQLAIIFGALVVIILIVTSITFFALYIRERHKNQLLMKRYMQN